MVDKVRGIALQAPLELDRKGRPEKYLVEWQDTDQRSSLIQAKSSFAMIWRLSVAV